MSLYFDGQEGYTIFLGEFSQKHFDASQLHAAYEQNFASSLHLNCKGYHAEYIVFPHDSYMTSHIIYSV